MPSPVLAQALKPGDTIAFISPSARLNNMLPATISRATALFSSRGYKVRVFFTQDGGTQSRIANRLAEIRSAFLDPTIAAIICTIGGDTLNELLPALIADEELQTKIRTNPKIVVGYSDITCLHWFLYSLTGLRTFYGPTIIPELGTADSIDDECSPLSFCVRSLFDAISKPEPIGDIPRSSVYAPKMPAFFRDPESTEVQEVVPTSGWKWLRPGKAKGRLFGGCLGVVVRLNGIRAIAPDWRGRIIFLENSVGDKDLDQVQMAVADLIAQGVFEEAAGLVVGRAYGYDSEEKREEYAGIFKELLCEGRLATVQNQFPILFNVDIGHATPMVTLPYDALAILDSERDAFSILEPGVA